MSNVMRWDVLDDQFDNLVRNLFRPVSVTTRDVVLPIKMDVSESDSAYQIHAEIPGVSKEDIKIEIEGNQVSISSETKSEKDVKEGERVLRSERYYGKVSRSFTLAQEVEENTASAKYENGVLELTLPKKATSKAKLLAVN
ncbi:MAG: Hsp20/alpha crystallin family protein [Burkholderiales bacterium]